MARHRQSRSSGKYLAVVSGRFLPIIDESFDFTMNNELSEQSGIGITSSNTIVTKRRAELSFETRREPVIGGFNEPAAFIYTPDKKMTLDPMKMNVTRGMSGFGSSYIVELASDDFSLEQR